MNTQSEELAVDPIRILVVDDHTLFRRGLTALLSRDPQLAVVGDAADAGQAQRKAEELQPDVILLDNHLPGVSGVDALPALHSAAPKARILMLTVSEDENDLAAALRGGAIGYLLKTTEGDDLTAAIRRAMDGDSVVAPPIGDQTTASGSGEPVSGIALEYLSNPKPAYPREALRDGLQGTVMLRVVVGADGVPGDVDVARSSGSRILDRAAMGAVKSWRFKPAMRNGQAEAATVQIPVAYNLDER